MLRNQRLKPFLMAGALTGLVLATIVAFTWSGATVSEDTTPPAIMQENSPTASSSAVLQAENAQLRSLLNTMQEREKSYHAQLEAANRSIMQLQDTVRMTPHDDHEGDDSHQRPSRRSNRHSKHKEDEDD